jgi:hypothetical protein
MFLVLDKETGEHDFSLKPMNCRRTTCCTRRRSTAIASCRSATTPTTCCTGTSERRAVRAHAGAAVLPGRLPRLPDGVADPRTR